MRARANETASGLTVDVFRCRVRDAILRGLIPGVRNAGLSELSLRGQASGRDSADHAFSYRFSSVLSSDLVSKYRAA